MKKAKKYFLHYFLKTSPLRGKSERGYTIIELSVVLVILSILAGVTIPNISKWLKLAKIDETKSLVNSTLAECIQNFRDGTQPADALPPDRVISNDRLGPAGYKIKDSDNKCDSFFVTPKSETEDILFELGFKITASGQVTKIATPANNSASLPSCKRWAVVNCGATAEQIAAWAAQEALEKAKQECETAYNDWFINTPPKGGNGSFNRWDSSANSCTKKVWACEGDSVSDENAFDACQEAILGAACNAKIQEAKTAKTSAVTTFSECPNRTFYFCNGEDKQTEALMNTCIAASAEATCKNDRETKRVASLSSSSYPPNGKWGPEVGPGECGWERWICNGVEHENEESFNNDENCNPPEPPCAPNPGTESDYCGDSGAWWDHPICNSFNDRCNYSR